jgi:putative FmdB family regulatory protein
MPFYEYQCRNCGHDLEAMQKFSDAPLKKCPQCGKSQLQRLMSAPVFRFKGGGWYETDFKGDKDNQRNLADRPEADAPKDLPQDTATDAVKDGADAKTEATAPKDATPKDKTADKPAEKASEPAKKSGAGKNSARRAAGRGKSAAKRPIKRPVHKAKRRI